MTDSELIAYIAECERVTCTNKYMVQVITKEGKFFAEYFDTPPSGIVTPFIHESREAALRDCLRKSRKE